MSAQRHYLTDERRAVSVLQHTAEQLSYEMCPYPEAPEVLERMAEAILRESADGLMKALVGVAAMRRVSPRGATR